MAELVAQVRESLDYSAVDIVMSHTDTTTVSEKFDAVDTSIAQANSAITEASESLNATNQSVASINQSIANINQDLDTKSTAISNITNTLSTKLDASSVVNLIYPVGSIYIAYNHTNPTLLFGGTWERIQNAFLWATTEADQIGELGGEYTHTLTESEMPSHNGHVANTDDGFWYGNYNGYLDKNSLVSYGSSGRGWNTHSGNEVEPWSQAKGGNQPHNNMPPYIRVSVWRRTA